LKNRTLRREVVTLLFSLKIGVFGPSITMPYGPHSKKNCYPANSDKIYGEHTPLRVPAF